MKTQVDDLTEANILNYTASLVGQTVTLPVYDKEGKPCLEKATEKLSSAGAALWISRWSMVPKLPASLRRTGCTCSTWPSRSIGMIGLHRR